MRRFTRRLVHELRESPYRRALRLPHIGLASEWQRIGAYTVGMVIQFTIGLPPARQALAVLLDLVGVMSALYGLRRRRSQAAACYIDLLIAPVVTAVTTLSVPFASLTGLLVGAIMVASFQIRLRVVAAGLGAGGAVAAVVAWALGGHGGSDVAIATATLVGVACVIAIVSVYSLWLQTQRSLRRSEAQLGSLLAATPAMLVAVGPRGIILTAVGQIPDARWTPEANVDEVMTPALARRVHAAVDGDVSEGDEEVGDRWIALTCVPSTRGATLTGFDITDREAARRELEELVETKDQFVASISHELRTPLTAVLGFAQELQRSVELSEVDRTYVDVVAEQSAEMAAIIEDLLVAVRADLGLVTILPGPVDIAAEAVEVANSLMPRLTRPVEIQARPSAGFADPVRVRQIIRNLLTNADRYGGSRVELVTGEIDGIATLEVRDDGPPLDDEARRVMFQPYQSSGRGDGVPSAIGLGLTVSRTLAEMMGGSLEYRHSDGWSTFCMALPTVSGAGRTVDAAAHCCTFPSAGDAPDDMVTDAVSRCSVSPK